MVYLISYLQRQINALVLNYHKFTTYMYRCMQASDDTADGSKHSFQHMHYDPVSVLCPDISS